MGSFIPLAILPLVSVLYLPFVEDAYDTGRFILLTACTIIIILLWMIKLVKTKSFIVSYNVGVLGFGLLTITSMLSVALVSANKGEALIHPLGTFTWLSLTILSLIVPTMVTTKQHAKFIGMIVATSSLLGLCVIYQQFSITALLFPNVSYLANPLWNPTGSPLSACYLLVLSIPLALYVLKTATKNHEDRNSALSIIAIVIAVVAIASILWRYVPILATSLLPLSVGWGILLESWKHPLHALFGVGADQFIYAYTIGKQLTINQTAIWNTAFATNASFVLHEATVHGLVGTLGLCWFFIALIRAKVHIPEVKIALIFALVILCFLPPSFPLIILFALLCLSIPSEHQTYTYTFTSVGVIITTIFCLGLVTASSFVWFRFVQGELLYYQGITAKGEVSNGTKAYNLIILAMRKNSYISRYHATFGQLNLVLGGSIAPDTQENQTLSSTLITQAIREGKTATTLAPNNVYVWSNLASMYQNLIGIASDAPSWTIAAYQKAMTLDPVNPVLRLDLGGVYVGMKDYDNALSQFTAAITLKPNYANAYYNLANVLKLKGNTKEAKAALENILELLPTTSSEYQKVSQEINALDTK